MVVTVTEKRTKGEIDPAGAGTGGCAMELIYEISVPGRRGVRLPACDVPRGTRRFRASSCAPSPPGFPRFPSWTWCATSPSCPAATFRCDTTFYPLGSCTMKYNPKVMEEAARLFLPFHPMIALLPGGEALAQGTLAMLHHLGELLERSPAWTRSPATAGRGPRRDDRHHADRRLSQGKGEQEEIRHRPRLLPRHQPRLRRHGRLRDHHHTDRPLRRHGPGSSSRRRMNDEVAAVMMTCPNTLGLFNPHIKEICDIAHWRGRPCLLRRRQPERHHGPTCGRATSASTWSMSTCTRPSARPMAAAVPGAARWGSKRPSSPSCRCREVVREKDGSLALENDNPQSIGRMANFFGNFGVIARAYAYITDARARGVDRGERAGGAERQLHQ